MSSQTRRRRALSRFAVTTAALAVCVLPATGGPVDGAVLTADALTVVPVANTTESAAPKTGADRNAAQENDAEKQAAQNTAQEQETAQKTAQETAQEAAQETAQNGAEQSAEADPTDAANDQQAGADATTVPPTSAAADASATGAAAPAAPEGDNNGLDVLGRDCTASKLPAHTGFQVENATCVSTAMGEVASSDKLPSLLITDAPTQVGTGEGFVLKVSTRNLVRDRFLGAAAGGYYLESSFLNDAGLQRGHFHTACRMLGSTAQAPDSSPAPAFFVATQDNGGGAAPDTVSIDVPADATTDAGTMQCSSWAGDGSHRTPMMSKANQTPAFDSVRIQIGGAAANAGGAVNGADPAATGAAAVAKQRQEAIDRRNAIAGGRTGVGEQRGRVDNGSAEPAGAERGNLADRFRQLREQRGG